MKKIFSAFLIMSFIISDAGYLFAQDPASEAKATQEAATAETRAAAAAEPVTAPAEAAPAGSTSSVPTEAAAATPSQEAAPAEGIAEAAVVDPGNVTVNFKGADIKTVLAYISEVAGVDIVPAPDVKGTVDLKLTNKPWKTALDIIVRNYGFAYEREGDIIRVVTLDKLKQEELTTQAFNLNYGKSKDIVAGVKDIVTDRGKVMYDERTNTVLVTDIPTNIYKIAQVIDRLDKRTDQVLIEARIIETVLNDDEKLGVDWNAVAIASGAKRPTTLPFDQFKTPWYNKKDFLHYFPQVQTGVGATTVIGGVGSAQGTTASFPGTANGIFGFPYADADQFSFGTLDFSQFRLMLEMIEKRADTDIVANPRIATLNNTEAMINVGETLNLPVFERNSTTGKMEITGYDPKDLGIILKVTPHINDRQEIVVDLKPEISELLRYDVLDPSTGVTAPVFSVRQAQTNVMIRDGDTIFIGGLIKEKTIDTKSKLPIIGDIFGDVPGLGLLVSHKGMKKEKTELIFFITVKLMTLGKELKGVPVASKAIDPTYVLTQEKDAAAKKKAMKRPWSWSGK